MKGGDDRRLDQQRRGGLRESDRKGGRGAEGGGCEGGGGGEGPDHGSARIRSQAAPRPPRGQSPGGGRPRQRSSGMFEEEGESEEEAEGTHGIASGDLLDFMRGFGHMQANESGWPVFDGRYASYLRFRKEWRAYRETYHSAVNNDLAARALRDKCTPNGESP